VAPFIFTTRLSHPENAFSRSDAAQFFDAAQLKSPWFDKRTGKPF